MSFYFVVVLFYSEQNHGLNALRAKHIQTLCRLLLLIFLFYLFILFYYIVIRVDIIPEQTVGEGQVHPLQLHSVQSV